MDYGRQNNKLTARELEVLKLIVHGKSNSEIAKDLNITHHTVKAHVSSILRKFNVETRVEAVIAAMRAKIID
ncbi:MAG: LuxR C-terminal-related transcriptional regulator [Heliobacteriaceae bacterium]|jgi:DNA-binding NarL/FixJ family response regulator|nr:LuxR C-terminal-related transcriptional regulator [Heliobacteriaceae bacterium]